MSLQKKVTLIVVVVFMFSGLMSFGVQRLAILPSFHALEEETARKNGERILEAVHRELEMIGPSVSDWAYWTDTYAYVKGEKPDYVEANLETGVAGATLSGMNINYLGIFDQSGTAVWTQGFDLQEEKQLDLGALTGDRLAKGHPLLQHPQLTSEVKGLIRTSHGPLLVFAKPILTNDRTGPPAGTIIMGRFLNESAVSRLADQTKLPFNILSADKQAPSDWIGSVGQDMAHSKIGLVESSNQWQAHSVLSDLYGQPFLRIQVDTPRDISARGHAAVSTSLYSLGITGLMMMLVMLWLLQRAVLRPISTLSEHALKIGADDNLHTHLDLKRKDEVGVLARTFDDMVDRLAEVRRRLIDQSYHSGVAEMASGVLHNIGNSITPLKVKLSALQSDLGAAPVAEMEQAAAELASPDTPEDRRGDLAKFMELAGVELAGLVKSCREKVVEAAQQVVHVQEILADQERFSRSARVMESVDMAAVIGDAAAGLSPEMKSAMQIEITPSVTETGAVVGTRAALQQVATNLLVNAAESILLTDSGKGKVTVKATQEDVEGQLATHLQIEDNGAGIQPENLERLFERGFSTKDRIGSGHGLHWSANTVKTLNGRITAQSEGVGRGACLDIWLPSAQESAKPATDLEG
jgi:two-component system NtrC family sensor kinase